MGYEAMPEDTCHWICHDSLVRLSCNSSFIRPQKKSHKAAVSLGPPNVVFHAGSFFGEEIRGKAMVGREQQGRRKANPKVTELVPGRGN